MKIAFSKHIRLLFFVMILLLSVQELVFAATATETVKRSTSPRAAFSATTTYTLNNLDLQAYKEYNDAFNSMISSAFKVSTIKERTPMLAKAKPNSEIVVTVVPQSKLEVAYSAAVFTPMKVAKLFPEIKDQVKKPEITGKGGTLKFVIPKGVEMVGLRAAAGYRRNGIVVSPDLFLFVFTSDDALQRAFNLYQGNNKTVPKVSSAKNTKTNAANKQQNKTATPSSTKDSGMSTTTVVGGAAVLGGLGWGAMRFMGGGGGAAAGGAAAGASVPNNPYYKKDGEDLIYTDPATGAQSIYSQDDNGNWVNQETGGVLDVSRADEAVNERLATKKWVENQRTKESETTKTLKELDRKLAEENEKITRETARDKIAVKTGLYGLTPEEKRVRFEEIKSKEQEKIAHYTSRGNTFAAGENIAKVVEYTADVAMDGLGAVGGPAKAITEGYKVVKSAAKGASESLVNAQGSGKTIKEKLGDMAGAAFKGGVNGVIDAVEYHVGGAGLKTQMAVNVVGDMLKGGLDAAYKGESIVKAAAKGAVSGTLKVGVNQAGAALGKKVAAKDLSVFRDKYNTIKNSWSKDLSEKTIDHHIKMTATKHVMTKSAHTVEMGMGKSVIKRGIGTMLK